MPSLKTLLLLRECKGGKPGQKVYKDSLGVPTVGIGHKVAPADKLKLGDTIDAARVDALFQGDTAKAVAAAKVQAAKAGIKDAQFRIYLASVNFQLGTGWTKKFRNTWKQIVAGDYAGAAEALKRSKWNSQTPVRVKDFCKALLALPQKEGAAK